jgi:hypothetical protein
MKNLWGSFFLFGLGVLGAGCEVQQAVAPQVHVQPERLKEFPPSSMKDGFQLRSNQLFLWPEGVTDTQVARVFQISDEMDQGARDRKTVDDQISRMKSDPVIQKTEEDLKAKKREKNTKNGTWSSAVNKLKTNKTNLLRSEKSLAEAKNNADQELIEKLQKDVDKYVKEIAELENKLPQLEADTKKCEDEVKQVEQSLSLLQKNQVDQLASLEQKLLSFDQLGNSLAADVMSLVDWYDVRDMVVNIKCKDDGTFRISIKNWVFHPVANGPGSDFSTEPEDGSAPTIQNVQYNPQGGIFDFDVLVGEGIFSFHIARNKYQDGPEKFSFVGDLKRKQRLADGSLEIRRGVAKLVDSNS